jgi:CRISPR-associated protein Cas5h
MEKLVSVDFQARFGFLKKPDINEGIYLTYNILHKPALLGILGAIAGLEGYKIEGEMKPSDIPQFREMLENLKVAIQPLNCENGNFSKDVIKYTNTVGYASEEEGGVLIVNEQTLINPAYRVYLLLNPYNEIHRNLESKLKNQEAEYIPYLGKNDHSLWWDNYQNWSVLDMDYVPIRDFKIDSIFIKTSDEQLERERSAFDLDGNAGSFMYFERLPRGWHSQMPHYVLNEFLLTDFPVSPKNKILGLLKINNEQGKQLVIQVF